jgi:hypothetical protein
MSEQQQTTNAIAPRLPYMELDAWKTLARQEKGAPLDVMLRKGHDLVEVRRVKAEGGDSDDAVRIVISTGDEDRSHDTIDQAGWDLSRYARNAIVLFGHDYYSPPVGKAPRTYLEGGELVSLPEFCPKDLYPFGHMIGEMVKGGFLNAASVGFRPKRYAFNEDRGGVDFFECELLEYSIVCVPDNPGALVSAKEAWGVALQKSVDGGLDVTPVVALVEASAGWLVKSGLLKGDPERENALRVLNRGRKSVALVPAAPGGTVVKIAEAPAEDVVLKAGRVLSKTNESALRAAAEAASAALEKITSVLDQVKAQPEACGQDGCEHTHDCTAEGCHDDKAGTVTVTIPAGLYKDAGALAAAIAAGTKVAPPAPPAPAEPEIKAAPFAPFDLSEEGAVPFEIVESKAADKTVTAASEGDLRNLMAEALTELLAENAAPAHAGE